MTSTAGVGEEIRWDADAIASIRSRGQRYPDGVGIETAWTSTVICTASTPDPQPGRT